MPTTTLILLLAIIIIAIQLLIGFITKRSIQAQVKETLNSLKSDIITLQKDTRLETAQFNKETRDDYQRAQSSLREEVTSNITQFKTHVGDIITQNAKLQHQILEQTAKLQSEKLEQNAKLLQEKLSQIEKLQAEKLDQLDKTQHQMVQKTEEKLENIRTTVEEKLDKTLSDRLGKSFETVGKQLNEVQQGLGEMKNLAQDVGGLKKVLSNVKMRGGLGEIQLEMLLENILAPDQFSTNVITKKGSKEIVEFAVKLPGKSDDIPAIWLPIDAKFPKDIYEKLQTAYDSADQSSIETAQKELDTAIKQNAKDISSKYLDPPYTTNFAIMFLPFEGIYAEVVRKAQLLEEVQKKYNVIITGPTTLAAILNSLQMGFKTLAIQKRSSEVWETLGAVKNEFEKFGGILEKAKSKIQGGLTDMDSLIGTRTRVIQSKLKSVEKLDDTSTQKLLNQNE
jgi:Uncharacterized protein conserved in bacteria